MIFRLRLGKHELVPIMIGGMGVDISTRRTRIGGCTFRRRWAHFRRARTRRFRSSL